jgi:hypothetical protein
MSTPPQLYLIPYYVIKFVSDTCDMLVDLNQSTDMELYHIIIREVPILVDFVV